MKFKQFSRQTLLSIEIIVLMLCVFTILLGVWSVDVGASGMVLEAQTGVEVLAGNGFVFRSACQQYHVGLYLLFAGVLLMGGLLAVALVDAHSRRIDGSDDTE